jgi:integrase/recombinase XerD
VLQHFFVRPATIDRIHACWIGPAIERYVTWLMERDYAARNVFFRVPVLVQFGEFARESGATNWDELPSYVDPFVHYWQREHGAAGRSQSEILRSARPIRNAIRQLLHLIIPSYQSSARCRGLSDPFADRAPRFFDFLRRDRGLREATVVQYQHHLRRLEDYLHRSGIGSLADLSSAVVTSFITETGKSVDKRSVQSVCSILKTFLRYLHQTGILTRDLSQQVESPRRYRLADLPRSISQGQAQRMLEVVDRRSCVGKRDYAILLLLVTYGLRAREVAALKLEDIDWKHDRLHVRGRKAGHSTAYPLAPIIGEALLDYLQQHRPKAAGRAIFFRALAPHTPLSWHAVSLRAKHYIRRAGIKVPRPGSHTLRHTCVQRLVDAHLPLKTIGDFVGHRTPDATAVYAKVDIEALREVALGHGEEIL